MVRKYSYEFKKYLVTLLESGLINYMVRKYSYEFKKYLVTLLESGLISANELARRHNIHKGVVCKIYNRYKQFGDESLQHTYTRNKYSREFKLNVLKYKAENNLSYEQKQIKQI